MRRQPRSDITFATGKALPERLRRAAERLFGEDFSTVRVHASPKALQLKVRAFTHGEDIHIAPDHYDLDSAQGVRLLGHELAHVVQQRAGRARNPHGYGLFALREPALEREAERMGSCLALEVTPSREVVQAYLQDRHGVTWMGGSAAAYWEENKEHLEALWAQEGLEAPPNILELIDTLMDEMPREYSIDELTDVVRRNQTGQGHFNQVYRSVFGHLPVKGAEIPKLIHRFWAGGAMSAQSFKNLADLQERAHGTAWNQILWTSDEVNAAVNDPNLKAQLRNLAEAGTVVLDATRLSVGISGFEETLAARISNSIQGIRQRPRSYTALKYLSDMVRLAATYSMGGAYLDTDIGPGALDLSRSTLYHRDKAGEVPLAGVQVQNTAAYAKAHLGDRQDPKENLFINTVELGQPVFNYFYVTRAYTESNRKALLVMIKDPEESGMTAAMVHFSGATNPAQWLVAWLMDLQWATSASDIEEGRTE
ncbi:DUF4157 domain-containing protein [Myxococcus sp. RHSTA-1-4]|uniref:eCIS core domain-containing protein n=1 Tax=Myxococcus sp. RHSTA-1-4 TaxID=2874601 RepID=UPI001CBB796D|nr:DUF4157 domain-containing protein [Myxococcus sp. RHSTA-1-4]MBZ4416627.1 DUF4157 domain-containing protein [Myxococcus sp. RHSTA-1-4]